MRDPPQPSRLVRFDAFELNLNTGELRKGGIKVRLQEQSFQILAALLERPGKLVTREDLQQRLWPDDTFVDFDKSLNIAVSKLRQALGDSAEEPRYIETLPRRGYRFIGSVEQIDETGAIIGLPAGAAAQGTISHYRLLEKVGEGGMGVVYKAEDTRLKRHVALKFLAPHLTQDPRAKRRFLREAQAAATVDHPNICAVHEIDESGGQTFIAMAHVEGETLDRKFEQGPLEVAEAVRFAGEVALGLEAAHQKGIVHRDIKGANIMITAARPGVPSQVKLMDFGLARLVDQRSLTSRGEALGTLSFAAPEQARGEAADQRADIWSLGVVLYQMVSGRLPFQGETDAALLYAILHKDPEPLDGVPGGLPPELNSVIEKCLAKDPNRRYQQAGELLQELGSIQRQFDRQQSEESGGKKTPRKRAAKLRLLCTLSRRRRWVWAFGIAAGAVALEMTGLGVRNFLPTSEVPAEPFKVVPFTTTEGDECCPSFSPDGNQIAFTWMGPQGENWDIYVKLIGPGPPLRLTTDPRREVLPVFSPDGREIGFGRGLETGEGGLFVIPALGGPERQLGEGPIDGGGLAWSPDGQHIVVSDRESDGGPLGLFAVSRETGEETKRLTNPPEPSFGDSNPAFSPDGRTLAFVRGLDRANTGYLLDIGENLQPQGEPRQFIPSEWAPSRLTWTADGTEIVFDSFRSGAYRLMRIPVKGGRPPRPVAGTGEKATWPVVSPQGNRLAFVRHTATQRNIWRARVTTPGGQASAPTKLISSSRIDGVPRYSPGGEKIAFTSNRSGEYQVWVSDADGANARQLTHRFSFAATPHWSPDSEQIVFTGRTEREKNADIYTMSAGGGVARRLTSDPSLDFQPTWSRDGRWIYFVSERGGGKRTAWKMPAEGGEATQVTVKEAQSVRESFDGEFLYYVRQDHFPNIAIWRRSTAGVEEKLVVRGVANPFFTIVEEGIYFIAAAGADGLRSIQFFDFATEETTVVLAGLEGLAEVPTVSPDGKTILLVRKDVFGSDIMVVENFR